MTRISCSRAQPLLVVGKLHFCACDLDAGPRAGGLLVLRLLQHRLGEGHVGLRGLHIGIRANRRQVGARHLRRHLLFGAIDIRAGRRNAHF
jgi:hypothetical protein